MAPLRSASILGSDRATSPSQWLVVIRRNREDLYRFLRERFMRVTGVDVVLDRRYAEGVIRHAAEAQRTPCPVERRRRLTPTERRSWDALDFRLVHRDQGRDPDA